MNWCENAIIDLKYFKVVAVSHDRMVDCSIFANSFFFHMLINADLGSGLLDLRSEIRYHLEIDNFPLLKNCVHIISPQQLSTDLFLFLGQ